MLWHVCLACKLTTSHDVFKPDHDLTPTHAQHAAEADSDINSRPEFMVAVRLVGILAVISAIWHVIVTFTLVALLSAVAPTHQASRQCMLFSCVVSLSWTRSLQLS